MLAKDIYEEVDLTDEVKKIEENKKFKGKIKTDQSVYDAYFVIKENKQYWDKVQQFSFYY